MVSGIVIDSKTKSLRVRLTAAKTTNDMEVSCSYVDTVIPQQRTTKTDGTNDVTIVDGIPITQAPPKNTNRRVIEMTIFNADTETKVVEVFILDGSTEIFKMSVSLQVNYTIHFDSNGWYVTDANGAVVQSIVSNTVVPDGDYSDIVVSGSGLIYTLKATIDKAITGIWSFKNYITLKNTSGTFGTSLLANPISDHVWTFPDESADRNTASREFVAANYEPTLGYTAENVTNKTDTVAGNTGSSLLYLSVKGYFDWLLLGLTQSLPAKTTPVDADSVIIEDSADSNKTKKTTWANIKATLFGSPAITTPNIIGRTDAGNAAAGYVGEEITASTLQSAGVSLTTATPANVLSITLTAGDWDISGFIGYRYATSCSVTALFTAVSLTSATLPALDTLGVPTAGEVNIREMQNTVGTVKVTGAREVFSIARYRISIASSTTYYLVARADWTTSTITAFGSLTARRMQS